MGRNITTLVAGLLIGSIIGFMAANLMVNEPYLQRGLPEETDSGAFVPPSSARAGKEVLSREEIMDAIARADREPDNLILQKELGTGLLRYATMTSDTSYLSDLARLLTRVRDRSPKDSSVLAALGDIELIRAQASDKKSLKSAEDFYLKSLAVKGDDVFVRSSLGLVYLSQEPPSAKLAKAEFEKALKVEPTNERALQGAALSSIKAGDERSAKRYIKTLKDAHPDSVAIGQLESELTKAANIDRDKF